MILMQLVSYSIKYGTTISEHNHKSITHIGIKNHLNCHCYDIPNGNSQLSRFIGISKRGVRSILLTIQLSFRVCSGLVSCKVYVSKTGVSRASLASTCAFNKAAES